MKVPLYVNFFLAQPVPAPDPKKSKVDFVNAKPSVDIHGANYYSINMSDDEKKAEEAFLNNKDLTLRERYLNTRRLQRSYIASNQYDFLEIMNLFPFLDDVRNNFNFPQDTSNYLAQLTFLTANCRSSLRCEIFGFCLA